VRRTIRLSALPLALKTVRLLSYNIHKGIGGRDRRYDIERIVRVLDHEQPDLVCLQEVTHRVRRQAYHDQADLLANRFQPAAALYQMNVHLKTGGYGNLLMSRWPIVARHQVSLRYNGRKPRGAQIVVIDTPQGELRLVNWHLGLAERERQWQCAHLLRHRLFREADGVPTLIAGDFNDWRNRLPRGSLLAHGLTQVTGPISRFRTFPAWFAVGSLDKAFVCSRVEVGHARVVGTRLAKAASDHLPVVVDFDLGGSPA
jgi:endonuclease/exonuclease/phosphatase family metal-dependent hydrolase